MFIKGKNAVKGDPKKNESKIEGDKGVELGKAELKISVVKFPPKGGFTFARIEKAPVLQSNYASLCGLRHYRHRKGGELDRKIVSRKRAADEKDKDCRLALIKKEQIKHAKNISSRNTSTSLKRRDFCDFKKVHLRAYLQRRFLSLFSTVRREASRNMSV